MSDPDFERAKRHAQTRRAKRMLRYAPRRAAFHRYPLIGRFAVRARRRAYLWSFKPKHVRPAIYLGTILSLWPVMGVQLPLALLVAFFMRCNFMVTGGLQFITNPLTAVPIYYGTYRVGQYVLTLTGFASDKAAAAAAPIGNVMIAIDGGGALTGRVEWGSALGTAIAALFVGGTLCGLFLALALDLVYSMGWKLEHRPRIAR